MTKLLRASLVALLGITLAAPAALAGKTVTTPEKGHLTVKDEANLFHKDSVIKAETKFHDVTFKSPTHLTVQTVDKVPADKKADFEKVKNDREAKHAFMREWVRELAPVESERGVFVLICQEARALEVVTDKQTDLKRHFGDDDAAKVAKILTEAMGRANEGTKTDDEKRTIRGEALVKATDYVIGQLRNTSAPEATGTTHTSGGHESTHKPGMPWWGWALIIVGVLLFIWIIVAIIRAASGNVYGPGYGGYYGGGGGGGGVFWPSFMGGMFGTMAGMWMYNSFFGGHMYYDHGAAAAGTYPEGGYDPNAGDTGAGDYDNGAEAGGDWGNDAGGDTGGDAGGGGDWGNDASGDTGGGDWGNDGGGGDWGGDAGGGGGDWGGGGGDFGGGGGDW